MPNHVRNRITVFGPHEQVRMFRAKAKGRKPRSGDKPDHLNGFNCREVNDLVDKAVLTECLADIVKLLGPPSMPIEPVQAIIAESITKRAPETVGTKILELCREHLKPKMAGERELPSTAMLVLEMALWHFRPDLFGGDEDEFEFAALVPLPPEYSQVPYGSQMPAGQRSGYDMERDTWGVKWGAYDARPAEVNETLPHGRSSITYDFNTAWSPPITFLEKVAQSWPLLRFYLSWGGEGPTRGRALFANGDSEDLCESADEHGNAPDQNEGEDDGAFHERYSAWEAERLTQHDAWVAEQIKE